MRSFSSFLIGRCIESFLKLDYNMVTFTGTLSTSQRNAVVKDFNAKPEVMVRAVARRLVVDMDGLRTVKNERSQFCWCDLHYPPLPRFLPTHTLGDAALSDGWRRGTQPCGRQRGGAGGPPLEPRRGPPGASEKWGGGVNARAAAAEVVVWGLHLRIFCI